jgi:hypothetical protein
LFGAMAFVGFEAGYLRQTAERQQACGYPLLHHIQHGKKVSGSLLHGIARNQAILERAEGLLHLLKRLHAAPIGAQARGKLLPFAHLRSTNAQLALQARNVSVCACANGRGGYVGRHGRPIMIWGLPAVHHTLPPR